MLKKSVLKGNMLEKGVLEKSVPKGSVRKGSLRGKAWGVMGGAMLALACSAAPAAASDPVFTDPGRQLATTGRLKVKQKAVSLPVTQVKWMLHGKFTARGGVFRGAVSSKEVVSDVDQARVRAIAVALQDDLAAQFRAAGWTVHTRAELGDNVPDYKPAAPNREAGYPIEATTTGALKVSYALVAPEGMPTLLLSGMTGAGGMGGLQGLGALGGMAGLAGINQASFKYARDNPGVTLLVDYGFATAALGETDSRMLGTEASPALVLTGGYMAFTANSQSRVNIKDGIEVAQGIGTLEQMDRTSTATNVVRYLSGMSTIDKTSYVLTPDWDKVSVEALRAGKAFNAQIVASLAD